MKILYAIQGTGNGHLSRAMDVVPCLQKRGDVDIIVSGIQGDLALPFPVKYTAKGLSFIFGKRGGVDLWKTVMRANFFKLIKAIYTLPVNDYDIVINDFEPVTAWACRLRGKACIAMSHQAAVLHEDFPKPEHTDRMGHFILKYYAPATARYGFHFSASGDNIMTPVVRQQVRQLDTNDHGHYTVYLPSYSDKKLLKRLSIYDGIHWDIFSKHCKSKYQQGLLTVQPIDNAAFTASIANATGILCGAGFETPAEALFLGKKLLVVPMKNQYEQQLNAAALKAMNIPVVKDLSRESEEVIEDWLIRGSAVKVNYPDLTQQIVDRILLNHTAKQTIALVSLFYLFV